MFKAIVFTSLVAGSFVLHAEEKTCAVKGMHCDACVQMVHDKVCDASKFAMCDVKVVSEKKELGQIHLITKDGAIDEAKVGEGVKAAGYELGACAAGKPKPVKKAKAS